MERRSLPPVDSAELPVSDGSESGPRISAPLAPHPPELSISPIASANDEIQHLGSSEPGSESTAAETAEDQTSTSQPENSNRRAEGDVETQYDKYVQVVSNYGYNSLDVVREFIDSSPNSREHSGCKDCLSCHKFTPYLLLLSGDKVETLLRSDDLNSGSSSSRASTLMDTIKARCTNPEVPGQQLVLLVEDLKPSGLKVLGGYLGIDPRAFARYLDIDKEFANSLPGVVVLDYVQGYFLEGPRADLFFLDQLASLNGRRGKLKRIWRNIVGHEQRVVITKVTNPSWQAPLSLVLFESIPPAADLQIRNPRCRLEPFESVLTFPLFAEYCRTEAIPNTKLNEVRNSTLIRDSIIRAVARKPDLEGDPIVIASLDFVCSKWQEVINSAQEAISESEIPDHQDVQLIRSITERRRTLGEMARTLSTLEAAAFHSSSNLAAHPVKELGKTVRNWIADLDGALSAMAVYLSLDNAARSIRQSRRTQQLTVLALIFVPISTVATAFGMNIDVLSTDPNPSFKWFILTAGVVTAVTFAYGVWYSYVNVAFSAVVSFLLYLLSKAATLSFVVALGILILLFVLGGLFTGGLASIILDTAIFLLRRTCAGEQLVFFSMTRKVFGFFSSTGLLFPLVVYKVIDWVPPWYNTATNWKQGVSLKEVPEAVFEAIPETVAGSYGPQRTKDRRAAKLAGRDGRVCIMM